MVCASSRLIRVRLSTTLYQIGYLDSVYIQVECECDDYRRRNWVRSALRCAAYSTFYTLNLNCTFLKKESSSARKERNARSLR